MPAAVRDLMLGERRQEVRCRPAFLVGLLGELGLYLFDRGQTQIGEEEFSITISSHTTKLSHTCASAACHQS
jgi:hypothetical protein